MIETPTAFADERVRDVMDRLPPNRFLRSLSAAEQRAGHSTGPLPQLPAAPSLKLMLGSLELTGTERVLEVGSTSGYETALLAHLAGEVVSLHPDVHVAEVRLEALLSLGCENVSLFVSRGSAGWPGEAPFQAIFVAGATPRLPTALVDQLAIGGRLVAPMGDATGQLIEVVRKRADGITTRVLGPSRLPLLPWATEKPSFFPWNRDGAGH
jgi:protein-L-isoaspartate(D-aspartate) O-methyltransferase